MSRSPLGQYGQIVAAGLAVFVIAAYVLALIFTHALDVPEDSLAALDKLAFLAAGAVFGAAAAVNGVKSDIAASHSRIDRIETATGIPTHGSYPVPPVTTPPAPPDGTASPPS